MFPTEEESVNDRRKAVVGRRREKATKQVSAETAGSKNERTRRVSILSPRSYTLRCAGTCIDVHTRARTERGQRRRRTRRREDADENCELTDWGERGREVYEARATRFHSRECMVCNLVSLSLDSPLLRARYGFALNEGNAELLSRCGLLGALNFGCSLVGLFLFCHFSW